jgi:hypothetical protein
VVLGDTTELTDSMQRLASTKNGVDHKVDEMSTNGDENDVGKMEGEQSQNVETSNSTNRVQFNADITCQHGQCHFEN